MAPGLQVRKKLPPTWPNVDAKSVNGTTVLMVESPDRIPETARLDEFLIGFSTGITHVWYTYIGHMFIAVLIGSKFKTEGLGLLDSFTKLSLFAGVGKRSSFLLLFTSQILTCFQHFYCIFHQVKAGQTWVWRVGMTIKLLKVKSSAKSEPFQMCFVSYQ